ncbi:MAG TPA: gluconeogenesis factor YvcK family protein [Candidatus Nanoarchaeia archaeon]|nr:gluconeogenesis factor YvcK family protein [Candidatus Nanoarchaeia archaeon]
MKKIVVIGGGTGSFTVLRGLKKYDLDITAVVSMFDSGGSTGLLRDEFGILPPGDVRRCLVALAEDGDNTLRDLFNYRFDEECSLKGHSFGNLLLTALTKITGSEVAAIKKAAQLLHIKGKVLPVSINHAHLGAELENGHTIVGETNIDVPKHDGNLRIKRVFIKPNATIYPETKDAIANADIITIGPGDLYSSILPNLLVEGMKEAISASKAKKVYICNLMTKWGETNNFTAADHVKEIMKYGGKIDDVICNNHQVKDRKLLSNYAKEKAFPVIIDHSEIEKLGIKLIEENIITEPVLIRHDSEKLAKILVKI